MIDLRDSLHKVGTILGAFWRTRMGKLTCLLLAISPWTPGLLLIPALYYGIRLLRVGMRRLLYSVRAKLAAFYFYAALLPILLFSIVLLVVLYLVFGQLSGRVVEARLDRQVEWAEERAHELEASYWRGRAEGRDPRQAAAAALDSAYGDLGLPGFASWAVDGGGSIAIQGTPKPTDAVPPSWLGDRGFVGIAVDSSRLVLRTRVLLVDGPSRIDVGCVLPIDQQILNQGLEGDRGTVDGSLGAPGRSLVECEELPDSTLRRSGIVAYLPQAGEAVKVSPTRVELEESRPEPADSTRSGWRIQLGTGGERSERARARADSAFREVPGLASDSLGLRSRYSLLHWTYVGHPVDWQTGETSDAGPPILTIFSVEGGVGEILRTGVPGMTGIRWALYIVAVVVGFLALLQVIASLMGLKYARAISSSVAKLDRGVHAIQAGDFGYRVTPRERDQLGALALAFNDMSGRLQGLLEERAAMQAVERELAIAREVQSRLFPERTPYAPYLEAAGVCVPARMVSGDYYDFIEVAGGYDVVVADVSGKGMSAALLMASLHSALRSLYLHHGHGTPPDLGEIVTNLNAHLNQYVEPTRFVTLFLARYRGDGKLLYCNAGHNPAALVQDGRVEWLSSGGLMLGPFADLVYEPATVDVRPGDLVCLYTDGVTEAESPTGEQYGEERLAAVMRDVAAAPAKEAIAAVQLSVRQWRGDREPGDDLTVMALRITC